jgi:hypothetical protein
MIVFVPPAGDVFARLLDTPRQSEALRRAADALAAFHGLTIDLGKEWKTTRHLDAVRRRVDRLARTGHVEARAARVLLECIEAAMEAIGERSAPAVLGLHPSYLRIDGACVATSVFDDVRLADPLLTTGDLIAKLAVGALERSQTPSAAERLRRAYADAAGCSEDELAAFEAIGLLSRACRRAVTQPTDRWLAPAIRYAASLVSCNVDP